MLQLFMAYVTMIPLLSPFFSRFIPQHYPYRVFVQLGCGELFVIVNLLARYFSDEILVSLICIA